MDWFKKNWKQVLVIVLSVASALTIYFKPEYRGLVLVVGAALGAVGINLQPIDLSKKNVDDEPTKPTLPKDPPSMPGGGLGVLALALALSMGAIGCGSSAKAAGYTKDLKECEDTSKTCDEYVACRSAAAAAQGRKFTGYCAKDGGAE